MSVFKTKPKNEEKKNDEVLLIQPEHISDEEPVSEDDNESVDSTINCNNYSYMKWVLYLLTFLLWVTTYVIFIKLAFGSVNFVVSMLVFMYVNTGKRKRGEVSAYSVFNKDCKSIDGTLKAEQFEREIRYGAGSLQ
ncbi:unnamed protein product [Brassicogethes aeneus]|uniref:SAYSvFN domain-containing protein n=1 Tax=Brassicogethes aeneus TaxID=1431903 RepID=A0A9P0B097_BRAAE|nr:unnamed protein product [Brassicogethes aeneus]